ncbi:NmrA family NAD(P)-binding protein [Streptomyces sp. CBMA152]|uniref:NmrA family NAD(P)-binding protein n=1 Tax=Streptomyces sp. CBMA152 TaxID=1896312 RepID=UPI00166027E7|nr:NmrA family NAD(P)-binding protein [Streptomyces sp. CBMA152]MBD0741609.1 NmrA family transcriptional regulator [Streptomyces sp. CBMA152]
MTNNERNTQENTAEVALDRTVLVTSGTGKTGHRVVERLTALGVRVRSGSRRGEVRFDWADESTWGPALAGADAAYVAYYPDLAAPGAVEAMRTFGALATRHGVRRLVLLSGRGEPEAVRAENALREAFTPGTDFTVVRGAFFAQNFSEGAMADGVLYGEIPFPAGGTAEPWVDADDIADVVVKALTEDGHAGAVHELTGPQLLTFTEVVQEISAATGRAVRYVPVSGAEYARLLVTYGLAEPEAEWLAGLFTTLLDGHNSSTTDGVKRVLGREPKAFADFARDAAAAGDWHL